MPAVQQLHLCIVFGLHQGEKSKKEIKHAVKWPDNELTSHAHRNKVLSAVVFSKIK